MATDAAYVLASEHLTAADAFTLQPPPPPPSPLVHALRSLPRVSLAPFTSMKRLSLKHVVKKAKMNEADAKLLGKLFVSCAKAAGGGHETLQGASINEATLLSMTAEDTPQTIHADDVVQSLAIIYNASNVASALPVHGRAPSPRRRTSRSR